VLVTLRLLLADGRQRQLSYEVEDHALAPDEILRRMNPGGEVSLGDRDRCPIDAVVRVDRVQPQQAAAPEWLQEGKPPDVTLRDEDVSTALREQ
jgi:hypothetical protein